MDLSPRRQAAFQHLASLVQVSSLVPISTIRQGFHYRGELIHLVNPRKGIHKPRQMDHILSIMTLIPQSTKLMTYDDQATMLRAIRDGHKSLRYAFMGKDPGAFENRQLRGAFEREVPIIYFLGVQPGLVRPIVPTFVVDWDQDRLEVQIEFGANIRLDSGNSPSEIPCRKPNNIEYAHRLHEVREEILSLGFKNEVFEAYGGRCTLCGLSEPRLLGATYILRDIVCGLHTVTNGLLLCNIHRAAFDGNIIGIDTHYRLHSNHVDTIGHKTLIDLKSLHGKSITLPSDTSNWPDRNRLRERFNRFELLK